MREIKFRGKRIDNGEWVYGYYFIEERDIEDGIIWRDIPQIQQRYGDHFQYFDVDPATIGQYTGRKDKNDTEIYEGDIVWCRAGEHAWGTWEYEKLFTVEYGWTQEMWDMMQAHEIEVIGNIHDNPELLGGAG